MKKHLSLVMAVCTVAILANTHHVHAQSADNTQIRISQLKAIFQQFKNYRYSPNLIWELPANRLKMVDKSNSVNTAGAITPEVQDFITNFQSTADRINFFAQQGQDAGTIRNRIEGEDPAAASEPGFNEAISYYVNLNSGAAAITRKGYVITTRNLSSDEDMPTYSIIALITTNEALTQRVPDNLAGVSPNEIRTFVRELDELVDSSANNPITIREYLAQAIQQRDVTNVTLEAQGIGDERTQFAPRVYGNTIGVAEDNLAQYMRITEGQPMDYQYPNEVTVSLFDLIRYRRYEAPVDPNAFAATTYERYDAATDQTYTYDAVTNEVIDSIAGNTVIMPTEGAAGMVYNSNLPKYGLEVRYGLEEINYPSIWSERLAVNALWGSSRLGVILPTRGWAGLSESFGQVRKLTSAGWGLNAGLDFPIKIISQSGIFNFAGGYVFDDASSTDHKTFYETVGAPADFLVRYDAQSHYSFAVNIDRDHFFRFKLGGTVYGMESWTDQVDSNRQDDQGNLIPVFAKASTETIGGISGRIEYMATNSSTPYGAGLQYFDEAIMADVWLQVPITRGFAFRIDAKGFAPILRDPRAWENKTVFIPTVRAIYNF